MAKGKNIYQNIEILKYLFLLIILKLLLMDKN